MQPEFNFFDNWYPLSPIEDLDPQEPTSVTLLGLPLVIWKPISSQTYRVFLDECPHRLAPLSEGRIDKKTGNLMCSYHGWEFDGEGCCTSIPQAEKTESIDKNRHNFGVKVFPTREAEGLLWVWANPHALELAAATELPRSPQTDASQGFVWSSLVRDLEYDWQTLIENVADPSHVPFSHHGVQGNREKAVPISIEIIRSTKDLIEAKAKIPSNATITFEPPCRLEYAIFLGDTGKQVGLVTYCVPVSPGKSRIVAQFSRNFAKNMGKLTPRWWQHIMIRNQVLDGDAILLHRQEHSLREKQDWKSAYKLPTVADRMVIEFRRWFDKYCQGELPWHRVGIDPAKEWKSKDNRRDLLDRYKQHTRHCRSCRGALGAIQRGQIISIAAFFTILSIVALMPDSLGLRFGVPLIAIALLGLGVYASLKFWLEPKFYFLDYVHARKD